MDGLTCNRLAVLGKPSSMGGCRSGAAVPIGSHQRKESTTEAIGDRHYWVAEGYCPWFTHGYRRLAVYRYIAVQFVMPASFKGMLR